MADLNLIDFYRDSVLALLHLQMSFPRQVELYVEDLIGPDQTDEFGLHSKRHEACLGALLWLLPAWQLPQHRKRWVLPCPGWGHTRGVQLLLAGCRHHQRTCSGDGGTPCRPLPAGVTKPCQLLLLLLALLMLLLGLLLLLLPGLWWLTCQAAAPTLGSCRLCSRGHRPNTKRQRCLRHQTASNLRGATSGA